MTLKPKTASHIANTITVLAIAIDKLEDDFAAQCCDRRTSYSNQDLLELAQIIELQSRTLVAMTQALYADPLPPEPETHPQNPIASLNRQWETLTDGSPRP